LNRIREETRAPEEYKPPAKTTKNLHHIRKGIVEKGKEKKTQGKQIPGEKGNPKPHKTNHKTRNQNQTKPPKTKPQKEGLRGNNSSE